MAHSTDVDRYLENWQDEIESAFLYRALANAESQVALAEVYRKLAVTEEAHARFWEDKLVNAGHITALADARSMTPQSLADWLARWAG